MLAVWCNITGLPDWPSVWLHSLHNYHVRWQLSTCPWPGPPGHHRNFNPQSLYFKPTSVSCFLSPIFSSSEDEIWSLKSERERERERERDREDIRQCWLQSCPPTDSKQTSISPYTLHKLYGHLTKIIVILYFDQTWLLVNLYIFICRSVGAWVYKSQMKLEEIKSLSIAKSILSIFLETLQCWYRGLNKLDISRSIHIFFCFLKISLSTV